jgi:CRISPR-associated endonuclease/helicase Cas3
LNDKIADFEKKTGKNDVDDARNDVSQQCLNYAVKPKGLYQLTVPTGGGKTLASLRFALNHAEHYRMDRIFYIIPFTSIIDQNAEELRKILEDKDKNGRYTDNVVLEHHSNLTPDEETKRQNLLSENWDAPVVFTTNVQFLEALFGSGTRSARRMHQLVNSVIIFDEVQTIPVHCVQMFNMALRFLTHDCGSTIVLCTATQPLLDKIEPKARALQITDEQQMMPDIKKLFKNLKRVEVHDCRKTGGFLDSEIAQLVQEELRKTGSILTIVNTKASARNLYEELRKQGQTNLLHLSTNMCPVHRLNILNDIKDRLKKNLPTICISTQLIEAGVDIDFGSVIRYVAGLDSIAQAAGRCNRHGIRPQKGRVLIVNPKDETLEKLKDIRLSKEVAERVLDEYRDNPKKFGRDVLSPLAMEQYYKYYFYARQNEMCYPVNSKSQVGRDDDLFTLLSTNSLSVKEYKRVHNSYPPMTLRQSFQTASKAFHAIDSPTRGVIVPYGKEGDNIVNQLCDTVLLEKQYKLLKGAQRYSINLYPYEFEDLGKKNAIREIQEESGIYYMDYQYYSNEFGWSKEIVTEMKNLTF